MTICTHKHKCILSKITVGAQIAGGNCPALTEAKAETSVLDCPQNTLTKYGKIADKYICQLNEFYDNIFIDKYVIMPNHIHLLIRIADNGQSGTPVPTVVREIRANLIIPKFVSTLKRFCNKEFGQNIWQARYHDHIIRSKEDYLGIWEYIDTNVIKWEKDCFYVDEGE